MILILDMYHKTGCKISIIILAWNLILSSSHPRQFQILSCPYQVMPFSSIYSLILCGQSCLSLPSLRTSPKKTLRISSDLILIIETHHKKKSKHSSSIEIVIISQRSLVNNQSLRTSPKNFFK